MSAEATGEATVGVPPTVPADLFAERTVLGSVLIRERISDVLGIVRTDDFFLPAHREIFDVMVDLSAKRTPLDIVTVASALSLKGAISRLEGGEAYLLRLTSETPTAEGGTHYAKIVRERATGRRLIAACVEAASRASREDPTEVLADLRVNIAGLRADPGGPMTMAEAMQGYRDAIAGRADGTTITRVPTGLVGLDHKLLGGAAVGSQVVIGGNAGMGKSSAAMQFALHAASIGIPCLFFSLEMMKYELMDRCLSWASGIDGGRIAVGTCLNYDEHTRIREHTRRLEAFPLSIDDRKLNIDQVVAEAERWRDRYPITQYPRAVIVLDYLQLLKSTSSGNRRFNRTEEVGGWARATKLMAGDLKAVVYVVSQLNRGNAKDGELTRPVMANLRDSGEIEQHADTILFPFREGSLAEFGIPKNRGAPVGVVNVVWNGPTTTFLDDMGGAGPDDDRGRYGD